MARIIKDIEVDGGCVNIHYFFSTEESADCIDVYDAESGNHIGEIIGVTFPDPRDLVEMDVVVTKINKLIDSLRD